VARSAMSEQDQGGVRTGSEGGPEHAGHAPSSAFGVEPALAEFS
jgi:hypothetical protein